MAVIIMRSVLCILTAAAAVCDVRTGRIPNRLILAGAFSALVFALVPGFPGALPSALAGMLLPLAVPGFLFPAGMIGAGDIKLFCVIGMFLGPGQVLRVVFLSFAAAAMQAVVILYACRRNGIPFTGFSRLGAFLGRHGGLRKGLKYTDFLQKESRLCFTPAVAAGLVIQLVFF